MYLQNAVAFILTEPPFNLLRLHLVDFVAGTIESDMERDSILHLDMFNNDILVCIYIYSIYIMCSIIGACWSAQDLWCVEFFSGVGRICKSFRPLSN